MCSSNEKTISNRLKSSLKIFSAGKKKTPLKKGVFDFCFGWNRITFPYPS